ncbi:MAG TPA: hypothetical protein PK631_00110 [Erysipelotrichaceae bacterium]|nr:hypothetical protein [Erysipelotrichaceae bacterium]
MEKIKPVILNFEILKKEKNKSILPVLYNISKKEYLKRYPELESITFSYAKSMKTKEVAKKSYRIIKEKESSLLR